MTGLASSLAEIEALKGITGTTACDIVVCPPFALIERAVERTEGARIVIGAQDCLNS
ncbi:triose-phosphate isomerase [Rhizobium leguminosarum]|uniref:triose-phosphate isomerase n=1 Tax=Rhizobium leguminosarum TaxID=384 RepID=UPI00144106A6|nr:triose-phosphate isomerase [Rhizobium leguminosarum]